jgi:hypothetical protein
MLAIPTPARSPVDAKAGQATARRCSANASRNWLAATHSKTRASDECCCRRKEHKKVERHLARQHVKIQAPWTFGAKDFLNRSHYDQRSAGLPHAGRVNNAGQGGMRILMSSTHPQRLAFAKCQPVPQQCARLYVPNHSAFLAPCAPLVWLIRTRLCTLVGQPACNSQTYLPASPVIK